VAKKQHTKGGKPQVVRFHVHEMMKPLTKTRSVDGGAIKAFYRGALSKTKVSQVKVKLEREIGV